MVTAVDTSVLLDVLLNDAQHAPRSIAALHRAATEGSLVICDAALAEIVPVLTAGDLSQFNSFGCGSAALGIPRLSLAGFGSGCGWSRLRTSGSADLRLCASVVNPTAVFRVL